MQLRTRWKHKILSIKAPKSSFILLIPPPQWKACFVIKHGKRQSSAKHHQISIHKQKGNPSIALYNNNFSHIRHHNCDIGRTIYYKRFCIRVALRGDAARSVEKKEQKSLNLFQFFFVCAKIIPHCDKRTQN